MRGIRPVSVKTMKNVLSKVGLEVHKEKVLLALITPMLIVLYLAICKHIQLGSTYTDP